jgi:hypothetical protein
VSAGTAAAVVVSAAVGVAIATPAVAAARGVRAGLALGVGGAAGAGLAAAVLAGPGPGLLAALPVAGLAVLGAGAARGLLRIGTPPAASAGGAALIGLVLLALPFLGDALVEARGPGRGSPAAIACLLGASPTAGAAGGALGVDFLRAPRAYGGGGGDGLSRIGAYYAHRPPSPFVQGILLAAAGTGLLLLARGRRAP